MAIKIKLRPMSEAPKDREIFAVLLNTDQYGAAIEGSVDHGNFHPLEWKERPWDQNYRPHWGMRWSESFSPALASYGGWFDPKDIEIVD